MQHELNWNSIELNSKYYEFDWMNWIKNKLNANWGKIYSKFACDCGVEKKKALKWCIFKKTLSTSFCLRMG
jgi:hypothetical protein